MYHPQFFTNLLPVPVVDLLRFSLAKTMQNRASLRLTHFVSNYMDR